MTTTTSTTGTAAALVAAARSRVEELDVDRFAEEADRPDTVVVDLREPGELGTAGRIPGSVHVPRGMLEFRSDPTSAYHDERLQPGTRTLLYCATGGRSALAAEALRGLGYDDVAHLAPGFTGWVEAGRPVEQVAS